MSDVNFGIVGCGVIGPLHAEAISNIPGARLVAVADQVEERAKAVAERFGCHWHIGLEQLLARRDIQVVNICTPSGLHAEMGIKCARAGKHVIVEKPMDLDLAKVDRLIRECQENGVELACIFQFRFNPAAQRIKRAIDEGRFGDLVFANALVPWYRTQEYYDSADWRGTKALDGGVLSNQAIHYIDQLCWFAGEVETVLHAQVDTRARRMEGEDVGLALLRFRNGAVGVVQASTLVYPGLPARVEVLGTRGSAVISSDVLLFYQAEGEPRVEVGQGQVSGVASDPAANPVRGHQAQIEDFVQALREGRRPAVNGQEARRSLQVLAEIYRAAGLAKEGATTL